MSFSYREVHRTARGCVSLLDIKDVLLNGKGLKCVPVSHLYNPRFISLPQIQLGLVDHGRPFCQLFVCRMLFPSGGATRHPTCVPVLQCIGQEFRFSHPPEMKRSCTCMVFPERLSQDLVGVCLFFDPSAIHTSKQHSAQRCSNRSCPKSHVCALHRRNLYARARNDVSCVTSVASNDSSVSRCETVEIVKPNDEISLLDVDDVRIEQSVSCRELKEADDVSDDCFR